MAGPLLQMVDARERIKSLLERGEPLNQRVFVLFRGQVLVELFNLSNVEDLVEDDELQYPEDGERSNVRELEECGGHEVTGVVCVGVLANEVRTNDRERCSERRH